MLEVHGADIVRKDYCSEAWPGPSGAALGWWRSRIPEPAAKKIKLAPNDILLELFEQLGEQPENQDKRYVLAPLLVRRRVLRLEMANEFSEMIHAAQNAGGECEMMTVYSPKRDVSYTVPIVMPQNERIDQIQDQLSELLIADAQ